MDQVVLEKASGKGFPMIFYLQPSPFFRLGGEGSKRKPEAMIVKIKSHRLSLFFYIYSILPYFLTGCTAQRWKRIKRGKKVRRISFWNRKKWKGEGESKIKKEVIWAVSLNRGSNRIWSAEEIRHPFLQQQQEISPATTTALARNLLQIGSLIPPPVSSLWSRMHNT